MHINKRYIVDEHGNLQEVVISLEDYRKIEELLGLDLDAEAVKQLREARIIETAGIRGHTWIWTLSDLLILDGCQVVNFSSGDNYKWSEFIWAK